MKIEKGATVEFHYELVSQDGECLESTRDDEPVTYGHGSGEILPGLEAALEGRDAGEKLQVELTPDEAYGAYDPEGLVSVPRSELSNDDELAKDEWITVSVTDTEDGEEGELEMRIVEVHEDEVILDANHPLAGQAVTFRVEVISVRSSDT